MSERASSLRPEELLAHGEWVRRLARSLVAGEDRADDVAQETWLHALRAPPADRSNLRGWLTRVVQNAARKLVRSDERRERRESHAPPPTSLPTPAESFERAALQRRVVDAVLGLEEMYRAPLLLRYFEELSASDVARALGLPLETARTRIKRGLGLVRERLRGELEGEGRSWERALAPLVGGSGPVVAVMAGGTWKLAGAAAVALGLALVGWRWSSSRTSPANGLVAGSDAAAASSDAAATTDGTTSPDAVLSRAQDDSRRNGDRTLLRGFVLDGDGQLVDKATIQWDDEASTNPERRCGVTAEQGEYAIASLPQRPVPFHVSALGFAAKDVTLDLSNATGCARHDFELRRIALIPVRILAPDATVLLDPTADRRPWRSALDEFDWGLTVLGSEQPLPPRLPPTHDARLLGIGIGRFRRSEPLHGRKETATSDVDGTFESPVVPFELSLLFKHVVVAHQTVTELDQSVTFVVDPAAIAALVGKLRLRCVDAETHEPLAGVSIVTGDDARSRHEPPTTSDGRFESVATGPGWADLMLRADGREFITRHVLIEPGGVTDLGDVEMDRAVRLEVSVVDPAGKPALAMGSVLRLDRRRPGEPGGGGMGWSMNEPGKLELPQLSRGRWSIGVSSETEDDARAAAVVEIAGRDPAPITLTLRRATAVTIAAHLGPLDRPVIELARADGFLELAAVCSGRGVVASLLPGSWSCSIFDGSTLLARRSFEVGTEPLRVDLGTEAEQASSAERPAQSVTESPTSHCERTPSHVVTGRVRDQAGREVANPSVFTYLLDGTHREAHSRPDGSYALRGLPAGRHEIVAGGRGCLEGTGTVEVEENAPFSTLDLVVTNGVRATLELTDGAGTPLEAALDRRGNSRLRLDDFRVIALRGEPGARIATTTMGVARCEHEWSRAGGTSFRLDVDAPLPVFAAVIFGERVVASGHITDPTMPLVLAIDLAALPCEHGAVQFRLLDAQSGKSIERAWVRVDLPDRVMLGAPTDLPPEREGLWRIDDALAGSVRLFVKAPNSQPISFPLVVEADEVTDLGDLSIFCGPELHGRVVDEAGRPVATQVRCRPCDEHGRPDDGDHFGLRWVPATQGQFSVGVGSPRALLDLPAGEFAIDPIVVDLTAASPLAPLQLVARRGTLVTVRAHLEPGDARRVRIVRADGLELFRFELRSALPVPVRLLAGRYQLILEQDGARPTERFFTVSDAALDLDVTATDSAGR
jgi:RNA polymerase sigma-70 factor (ECF subfamily)